MRDLGQMGESTFNLWCADVGLIANGSQIDKTGWDFFVEFPFHNNCTSFEVHKPAIECKVQVKATDKNEKKIQITLSNLRRLVTLQMPAFFIFIEFDGKNSAQRAYVVHVDNILSSKVIKRLHQIEQGEEENKLNKRKMTIHYNESNEMITLDGTSLKKAFESYIGNDFSKYIEEKTNHLQSTGFENGTGLINFTLSGLDDVKKLIDASLGFENKISINNVKGKHQRFGITNTNDLFKFDEGDIELLNIKPFAKGLIVFKQDNLSIGLSFNCNLYISSLNKFLPKELQKIRIEGDFFDFVFTPSTGESRYSFTFGDGVSLELKTFRNALQLIKLLSSNSSSLVTEVALDNMPSLEFKLGVSNFNFEFAKELSVLNSALELFSCFEITKNVDISFKELSDYGDSIHQLAKIFQSPDESFIVEFSIIGNESDESGFDPTKKIACIYFINTNIGNLFIGVILVLTGYVKVKKNNSFRLSTDKVFFEKKIVLENNQPINHDDIYTELKAVDKKYEKDFSTVALYGEHCD